MWISSEGVTGVPWSSLCRASPVFSLDCVFTSGQPEGLLMGITEHLKLPSTPYHPLAPSPGWRYTSHIFILSHLWIFVTPGLGHCRVHHLGPTTSPFSRHPGSSITSLVLSQMSWGGGPDGSTSSLFPGKPVSQQACLCFSPTAFSVAQSDDRAPDALSGSPTRRHSRERSQSAHFLPAALCPLAAGPESQAYFYLSFWYLSWGVIGMSPQCGNSYSEHKGSKRAWSLNSGRTLAWGLLAGMALVSWSTGEASRWVFPSGVTSRSFRSYAPWWTLPLPAFSALFDEHVGELLCGLIPTAEWSPSVGSSCPSGNCGLHLTVCPLRYHLGSFKLFALPLSDDFQIPTRFCVNRLCVKCPNVVTHTNNISWKVFCKDSFLSFFFFFSNFKLFMLYWDKAD